MVQKEAFMDFVLELKGITKRFGSLTANDKIKMCIRDRMKGFQ